MKLTFKFVKISTIVTSVMLMLMGVFHGSGFNYVNNMVQVADVPQFIKHIFPVLFILPSIQLFGLGILGILAIRRGPNYGILLTLSVLILIDSLSAFWLEAVIPGVVLLVPSVIYFIAARRIRD